MSVSVQKSSRRIAFNLVRACRKNKAQYYFNTSQIANILSTKGGIAITETTVRKIGTALKKHGFQRISKNKAYVFPVILKDYDLVDMENKQSGESIPITQQQEKIPFKFDN